MVGGYEISLVLPDGTSPELVREYFELVREKERAVDEEWGGRPLAERNYYFELDEPTSGRRDITRWLEPDILELLDEERIDALFAGEDGTDPVIYDRERISKLLDVFLDGKAAFISQSRKKRPELWYEGMYIALLEFARDRDDVGVSIPR